MIRFATTRGDAVLDLRQPPRCAVPLVVASPHSGPVQRDFSPRRGSTR